MFDAVDTEAADNASGALYVGVYKRGLWSLLANDEYALACLPTHPPLLRQGHRQLRYLLTYLLTILLSV